MMEVYSQTVEIKAAPETVYDHFLRPELLVTWMGDYAKLDASEGGLFSVDINGVLIRGTYKTLRRPNLIEVAWGEAGNVEMPPGATNLRIEIKAAPNGSILTLTHSGLTPGEAKKHSIGWPHFLTRLTATSTGVSVGPDPWQEKPPDHS